MLFAAENDATPTKPAAMAVGVSLGIDAPTAEPPPLWLVAGESSATYAKERSRRLLNVLVAAALLILLAPVILIVAILVRLSGPGPIIYRQRRVGVDRRRPGSGGNWRRSVDYGGRLFTIYKFRTMRADADRYGQVWATPDDDRVTPVGRFLRKYRLDELPQLVNVLKGDMNVVGPRPEQPEIFASLRDRVPGYQRRQRVLPGITGWAQVNLAYDRCLDDVRQKVHLDLEYLSKASLAHDVRILMRTIPIVALRKGAW